MLLEKKDTERLPHGRFFERPVSVEGRFSEAKGRCLLGDGGPGWLMQATPFGVGWVDGMPRYSGVGYC